MATLARTTGPKCITEIGLEINMVTHAVKKNREENKFSSRVEVWILTLEAASKS